MAYPVRQQNRLKGFDYGSNGAYHVIICTSGHRHLFWKKNGECLLSPDGKIVKQQIKKLSETYETLHVDKFVIMPNHLHLLLSIDDSLSDEELRPTVIRAVKQFKGAVTKALGYSPWQKSFFDHAIRCEDDYKNTWPYIENNPSKWRDDEYFIDITD